MAAFLVPFSIKNAAISIEIRSKCVFQCQRSGADRGAGAMSQGSVRGSDY